MGGKVLLLLTVICLTTTNSMTARYRRDTVDHHEDTAGDGHEDGEHGHSNSSHNGGEHHHGHGVTLAGWEWEELGSIVANLLMLMLAVLIKVERERESCFKYTDLNICHRPTTTVCPSSLSTFLRLASSSCSESSFQLSSTTDWDWIGLDWAMMSMMRTRMSILFASLISSSSTSSCPQSSWTQPLVCTAETSSATSHPS